MAYGERARKKELRADKKVGSSSWMTNTNAGRNNQNAFARHLRNQQTGGSMPTVC
jgi:hypothetical protein